MIYLYLEQKNLIIQAHCPNKSLRHLFTIGTHICHNRARCKNSSIFTTRRFQYESHEPYNRRTGGKETPLCKT